MSVERQMLARGKDGRLRICLNPLTAPTRHPTPLDIAWAAGIYEGEGYCKFKARTQHCRVCQNDRWILDRLRDLFGGAVSCRTAKSLGNPNIHNPSYDWMLCGIRARGFLQTVFVLLSPRRKAQVLATMRGEQ